MGSTSKPKRTLKTLMRQGSESTVSGYEGMLLRAIENAVVDYRYPRSEFKRQLAIEFFLSDWYRKWLELLDLPVNSLPEGMGRADLEQQWRHIRKGC